MTKDQQEEREQFIRVGTTLYKIVNQPSLSGGYIKKRIPWNIETLRQDYGKDYMASVPKYDGFCTVPQHLDYQPVVGKFLNLYEPISHKPMQGTFPYVESLVHHIFGEQYELGMDYLQLLYLQPVQKLPILLLVSEERNTGKSTFLNFLKAVFQNNVTFNTNEDFRSQFNSDWAGKLLIMVDEVLLNRREDSERLKNLSTTFNYKVEAKGKDRDEIPFFSKFVLCSNNEHLPVIIDAGETRYWVRKISHLESDDTDFLRKLTAEIPAFLHHLTTRQLSTERESRMWFNPQLIQTEALRTIIRSNRNRLEKENAQLHREVDDLNERIDRLHIDMQKLKDNHTREKNRTEEQHQQEVSNLKRILDKAHRWFPSFKRFLNMERECLDCGFNAEQTDKLLHGQRINYSGWLHSNEYRRNALANNVTAQVIVNEKRFLFLHINNLPIAQWFKEQFGIGQEQTHRRGFHL